MKENLRDKLVRQAKSKLSVHRAQGVQSNLNIIQVAALMDHIYHISVTNSDVQPDFYEFILN